MHSLGRHKESHGSSTIPPGFSMSDGVGDGLKSALLDPRVCRCASAWTESMHTRCPLTVPGVGKTGRNIRALIGVECDGHPSLTVRATYDSAGIHITSSNCRRRRIRRRWSKNCESHVFLFIYISTRRPTAIQMRGRTGKENNRRNEVTIAICSVRGHPEARRPSTRARGSRGLEKEWSCGRWQLCQVPKEAGAVLG